MNSLGAFNLIGLTPLGLAVLVATSLLYGPERRASVDLPRRFLAISGWFLTTAGVIGAVVGFASFLATPLLIVAAIVLVMAVRQYRRQEQAFRLWQIAIASERGISLSRTLRAQARDTSLVASWKPGLQADVLEAGNTLATALATTRDAPPRGPALAVGAVADFGRFGPALREALLVDEELDYTLREELGRLFYLYVVLMQLVVVQTFMMIKIVPVFAKMLSEFDLKPPPSMERLVDFSLWFADRPWLAIPFVPLMLGVLAVVVLQMLDLWPGSFPGFSWFTGAIDRAWVLRGIAWGIDAGRPIPEVLEALARHYQVMRVRWKLDAALADVRRGVAWIEALRGVGLLRESDAAVLRSAERVGNLGWALREQAESSSRSWGVSVKRLLVILFPLAIGVMGWLVAHVAWCVFSVLSTLIEKLA